MDLGRPLTKEDLIFGVATQPAEEEDEEQEMKEKEQEVEDEGSMDVSAGE
jgi:hypothetical protein